MYKFSIELKKKQKRKIEKKNWISFFLGEPTQIKMKKKEKKKKKKSAPIPKYFVFFIRIWMLSLSQPNGGKVDTLIHWLSPVTDESAHPQRTQDKSYLTTSPFVPKAISSYFFPMSKKKKNSFLFSFQKIFLFCFNDIFKNGRENFFFKIPREYFFETTERLSLLLLP